MSSRCAVSKEVVHGGEICGGHICHVDVVAERAPVWGRVVVAIDEERLATLGRVDEAGEEVRLGVVALANTFRAPCNVEIAQRDRLHLIGVGK